FLQQIPRPASNTPFSSPSYFSNKFPAIFFSNYPAVSPPLGLRWEADANTSLCSVNATRSPSAPIPP
ncbi:MAG: hypothetical protein RSE01_08825, partial [Akkermansia sp.]